ncbi:flagellin [Ensifer adhaerens]|uniref:flagellin N-terminal helical domain-containing protein n=1 Tax=Ensifer adhaerens TaxID=106592 RepID=UPI003D053239
MTSIMTNTAAMAALQTLRSINSDMAEVQDRISSGYRVQTAADNAAYWSIATTMRSDNAALSTVQDALGLGAAKIDTASAAMNSSIEVVSEIKRKLVAATEPGVDKLKIDKEITELKNQLISAAQSASFSSENWLYNANAAPVGTKSIVASFNRDANGNVSVTSLDFDTSQSMLIDKQNASRGILTRNYDAALLTTPQGTAGTRIYHLIGAPATTPIGTTAEIKLTASTTPAEMADMLSVVERIFNQMTDAGSTLGAISKRIELQEGFIANLMDTIDKGVGRLVDADMNEESTRLKALQTQQQLGIQALSIANTNSENILRLFQQ